MRIADGDKRSEQNSLQKCISPKDRGLQVGNFPDPPRAILRDLR
jgi:hypothetical protein